jgi:hypothetical protein
MPDAGATRKRQFRCRGANKNMKSVWLDIGPVADAARAAIKLYAAITWSLLAATRRTLADCVFSQTYNPHSLFAR